MSDMASLVSRLESVTTRLESLASKGGVSGGGVPEATAEVVEEYDSMVLGGKLKKYLELSAKIGGDVAEHAKVVHSAFQVQRQFLDTTSKHKTPAPDIFQKVTKPTADKVQAVQDFCDKRRGHQMFNHLMTVKEGIGCIGWVTVAPKPAKYVKEMYDQSLFYGNRVLKEFKGKEDIHVDWMRAFTGTILELQEYVKTYHVTGLTWNPEGREVSGAPPPPPPSVGAPPPPPPPAVQPPTEAPSGGGGSDTSAQRANLFAEINKGGDVTKGLRKVTNEMKTYKNPELRASSVVKAGDVKQPTKAAPKFSAPAAKKPPLCELQGKKWIVEYQEDNPNINIANTNSKQAVYIFRCTRSTIKVSGKVNSIILDNCKRVALVFDDCISSVEIINSQGAQVQIMGKCPTVSIDKTDGCQVFLSKESTSADIITAKSSEMNICIPKGDGDFSEHAIPEQFRTKWNGKSLVTQSTDING